MKTPIAVDERKLVESLRKLSVLMETEVKLGTTSVFKFQNIWSSYLYNKRNDGIPMEVKTSIQTINR